ncbi:MAG: hypothetical protein CR997_02035 [Acidobacteria bacterium]|nr:MAG: hypothetical protein CR997_02035 [Acidobacteriota bacterium]
MKLDDHMKELLKRLGTALHHAMAKSEDVTEITTAIREKGYNLFLVMEANIALERKKGERKGQVFHHAPAEKIQMKLSQYDREFLSGMQIKID